MRRDIIKGVQKLFPATPDMRPAYMLPHYFLQNIFLYPGTIPQIRPKAPVLFGFLCMFRFSVREAWCTKSFNCQQDRDGTPDKNWIYCRTNIILKRKKLADYTSIFLLYITPLATCISADYPIFPSSG